MMTVGIRHCRLILDRLNFPSVCRLLLFMILISGTEMIRVMGSNYSATFGIVTSFTLNNPFLKSETANQGMIYGLKGISMYSLMHGYTFLPIFVPPPIEEHNWNRVRMTLQLFQRKGRTEVDCMHDWVVWMESDQFITNYHISLESIVEQAIAKAGKIPDLIVNRDAAGNINTGIMFIRCSEMGRKAMTRIRELQISHAHNRLVDMWDSNGCVMLLHKEIEFREVRKCCNPFVNIDAASFTIFRIQSICCSFVYKLNGRLWCFYHRKCSIRMYTWTVMGMLQSVLHLSVPKDFGHPVIFLSTLRATRSI